MWCYYLDELQRCSHCLPQSLVLLKGWYGCVLTINERRRSQPQLCMSCCVCSCGLLLVIIITCTDCSNSSIAWHDRHLWSAQGNDKILQPGNAVAQNVAEIKTWDRFQGPGCVFDVVSLVHFPCHLSCPLSGVSLSSSPEHSPGRILNAHQSTLSNEKTSTEY